MTEAFEHHDRAGTVSHVDGNALAGPLSEIFHADMTMATGECRSCHDSTVLARALVEVDAAGFAVRCCACSHVLFTVVRTNDRTWVDLQGIAGLAIAHGT